MLKQAPTHNDTRFQCSSQMKSEKCKPENTSILSEFSNHYNYKIIIEELESSDGAKVP